MLYEKKINLKTNTVTIHGHEFPIDYLEEVCLVVFECKYILLLKEKIKISEKVLSDENADVNKKKLHINLLKKNLSLLNTFVDIEIIE